MGLNMVGSSSSDKLFPWSCTGPPLINLSLTVLVGHLSGLSPFGMGETGQRPVSNVTTYYRKPGSLSSGKPLQLCVWLLYNQTENPEGRKALQAWHIRVI